uniref:Uncharacterized protein n=1 Tax=Glossina brevipalpis TaxID=37001 RepID=A0A1A9WB64_9MUSC
MTRNKTKLNRINKYTPAVSALVHSSTLVTAGRRLRFVHMRTCNDALEWISFPFIILILNPIHKFLIMIINLLHFTEELHGDASIAKSTESRCFIINTFGVKD